jgi:peroxiredoxin
MESSNRRGTIIFLLITAIVILVVQNYLLVKKTDAYAHQVKGLITRLDQLTLMKVGDKVSPLTGLNMDSASVIIDPAISRHRTLMLVFTTWCKACRENVGNWNRLSQSTPEDEVELVGICLDPLFKLHPFVRDNQLGFPCYSVSNDTSAISRNRFHAVPQTIILDAGGTVRRIWAGTLDEEKMIEIQQEIAQPRTSSNTNK